MFRPFFVLLFILVTLHSASAAESTSLEGTLLVVNRADGSVSLIDLASKSEVVKLPIGQTTPHEIATSRDGRWAITGEYGSNNAPGQHVVVIDVAQARISKRINLGPDTRPHGLAFLSDSRHAVVTIQDSDALVLVDIITGEEIRRYPTGGREGHMVKLSQDESQAYVSNRGGAGTLSLIWLNETREPQVIPTGRGAEGLAVSPDGQEIWVANQGDGTITIVNAESFEVSATIQGPAANRIEFLANGQAVIPGGASDDNSVRYISFYDGKSHALIRTLELPGSLRGTGVRLLAQGNALFLADSVLNEISVLDPRSNSPEFIMTNTANVDGIAWSPLRVEEL